MRLGRLEGDAVGELVEQPGAGVHVAHEVAHLGERGIRRADDDVDALAEHGQLVVGDERRHLDEGVGLERQPGHLAVDPDDAVGVRSVGPRGGHGGHARARRATGPCRAGGLH